MALVVAIVLLLIIFGLGGKDRALTNKHNREVQCPEYKENRKLEEELERKIYQEFRKIREDKEYISDYIPLEYHAYYRQSCVGCQETYYYVKARVKEIMFEQGYKASGVVMVKHYNKFTGVTTDERDKDLIYGLFNSKVLPKIKEFNDDYTEEERKAQRDLKELVDSAAKIKQEK